MVIVDESFARTYWPDGNALGKRVRKPEDGSVDWYTIVGVVPHVKHGSFTGDEFENTVYWRYLQRAVPPSTGMFVLRTALPVEALTSAAQAMVLTLVFAAIAVALAVIGVSGVLASQMPEGAATDPIVLAAAALVLTSAALIASWLPRAARHASIRRRRYARTRRVRISTNAARPLRLATSAHRSSR